MRVFFDRAKDTHELTSCGCGVFLQDADLHKGADEERPNINSEIAGGERGGRVGSCHEGERSRRCLDGWCIDVQHLAKLKDSGWEGASPLALWLWSRNDSTLVVVDLHVLWTLRQDIYNERRRSVLSRKSLSAVCGVCRRRRPLKRPLSRPPHSRLSACHTSHTKSRQEPRKTNALRGTCCLPPGVTSTPSHTGTPLVTAFRSRQHISAQASIAVIMIPNLITNPKHA